MRTRNAECGEAAGPAVPRHSTVRQALLLCGVLSSLLYVVINVLGAQQWEGYSLISQTISELSALDTPSRAIVVPLTLAYDVLLIAFGVGVWLSADRKRTLRVTAGLLVLHGAVNLVAAPFASMHQREVLAAGGATLSDSLHLILGTVCVLTFVLAVGFGAAASGKGFRLYSIATLLVILVFAALVGIDSPRLAANLPTPYIGLWERILVFAFMLWVAVLAVTLSQARLLEKILLPCGVLAALLYVVSDIVAATQWANYSFTAQSVSELRAIGAPTRPFLVPVLLIYAALEIAFGLGVWTAAGQKRALRTTGALLLVLGLIDLAAPLSPMHLRGTERTLTDTMHIVFTMVTVLLILLIIGLGATADGKWFRLYSFGTLLILIVMGAWAGADGPRIAANLPTPWMGVRERINIYGYMLWMAVLSITLLHGRAGGSRLEDREKRLTT